MQMMAMHLHVWTRFERHSHQCAHQKESRPSTVSPHPSGGSHIPGRCLENRPPLGGTSTARGRGRSMGVHSTCDGCMPCSRKNTLTSDCTNSGP